MSVSKPLRKQGKLGVLDCIERLTLYTINACKSEQNFPKRDRWIMPNRILNEALDAMTCVAKANAIFPSAPNEADDWAERHRLQAKAYAHLEAMNKLIDIAYQVPSYTINAEHWEGLIITAEKKLQAWRKSDKERQKKALEAQDAEEKIPMPE